MDSSVSSLAQAFFDTGKGFNQLESTTVPIAAGSTAQTLVFPLPTALVRALRFDPLTVPGTVHLHSAVVRRSDTRAALRVLDLHEATALNEIARLTPQPGGLEAVTTPDSGDSQLGFALPVPIDPRLAWYDQAVHWIGVDVSVTMVAFVAFALWWSLHDWLLRALYPVRWLDGRFAAWAAKLSRPEVVRLDRWAFWFYGGCALIFGALAAAGIHGSSLDEYATQYPWSAVKTTPLYGHAEGIRSDEWALQTPAFLNQLYRREPLRTDATAFGNQNAALLISLPCRDFTQAFRPEFWGFRFLPPAAAFAVYWQAKGFILLTGIFSLLLLLTRGHTGLSALGAGWMFFSAHMQWAYSWTSLLPEMAGFFGWTLCLTFYLSVGRNRYALAAAAVGGAISALDFALCVYPPHQIPFVLFGALLAPVWLWMHRAQVLRPDLVRRHVIALAACWGIVALVLGGFYLETHAGIVTAANTVYPGQRVSAGGGVPLEAYLSHFLDFWKTEQHFPAGQGNVCEGTGFLWLLPVTLFVFGRRRFAGAGGTEAMLAVCWLTATVIAAWTIFPVPASVGHWLLLDHVPADRCLPALGLINVVGVILYLSLRRPTDLPDDAPAEFWRAAGAIAAFLGAVALLTLMNTVYHDFFTTSQVVVAAFYAAALTVLLLARHSFAFGAVLLVPLVLANGAINPVDRGLGVVTRSPLFRAVQSDRHLRDGRWLVYSHDFTLTGFVVATGADVFNSFKVLPDLAAMSAFDPSGASRRAYNQSGHMVVRPLPAGQPSRFENPDVGLLRWSVSPLDPALRRVGVHFEVFDEEPDGALVAGLRRILPAVPGIWIYELP